MSRADLNQLRFAAFCCFPTNPAAELNGLTGNLVGTCLQILVEGLGKRPLGEIYRMAKVWRELRFGEGYCSQQGYFENRIPSP